MEMESEMETISEARARVRVRVRARARAQVLVLPIPIQGHINPMLQFSKRLAAKGLKVTLLATASTCKSTFQGPAVSLELFDDGVPDGEMTGISLDEYVVVLNENGPSSLAEIVRSHSPVVRAVVYDSMLPWALGVARGFGVEGVPFFTQNCGVNAVYYHKNEGRFGLDMATVSLPFLPELDLQDIPTFIYQQKTYPGIYDLVFSQFSNIDEPNWQFCNTFHELEPEMVNWTRLNWPIMPIGPTVPSMFLDKRLKDDQDYGLSLFKPDSAGCMKWLDSKQPGSVVYASFGSLAAWDLAQMEEVAFGIKNSGSSFLWVVRETEEDKLPTVFKDQLAAAPEVGLIVSWSPQLGVLAHESVGCFFTHCGWNSTLEALSLGVPMVAMPQWSDQPTNSKFVIDVWRVGVRVKPNKEDQVIRREEIERCIREVMHGDRAKEFARNADKWKRLAREAVDKGGSSDKNIDQFVRAIRSHSKSQ